MVKVAGSLGKSAEVMKIVNNLMKVPELAKVMQDMSKGEQQQPLQPCCHAPATLPANTRPHLPATGLAPADQPAPSPLPPLPLPYPADYRDD